MTAKEFELSRIYKDLLIKSQTKILDRYEFAEAYKEHDRERYEALVRVTNAEEFEILQKQVDELKKELDEAYKQGFKDGNQRDFEPKLNNNMGDYGQ